MSRVLSVATLFAVVLGASAPIAQDLPYRLVPGWPQLPSNIKLGGVISVDADAKGNIWVFHRNQPPILEFNASGTLINSFGTDMFVQAHGMTIDRDGNVWVTDSQVKDGKGQQVFKFSPEGKLLLSLGKADIIRRGTKLGVPYELTWSCYDPVPVGRACGRCDSCRLRAAGFRDAGVPDPTRYREGG